VLQREADLRVSSETLESRVDERTRALGQINERLTDEIEKHTILERELTMARDLAESANRAKSVFLATMSHELRTPLTAIIGYSEMLQEDLTLTSNMQTAEDIDSILRSARHLLSIINDVLNLAKTESDRMQVDMAPVNIHHVIEDACVFVLPLLESNFNEFIADIHPQLDRSVWSDELKIRQILTNLLSNAAKFTENGQIHMVARLIVDHETEEHTLRLVVSDTGIGIREEQMEQLFEPFVQLDSSRNRKYPGTGLGLALTQRLCELLDGTIEVTSVYHEGTTFVVTIPVKVEPIKI